MVVRSEWRIGPSSLESSAAHATAAIAATAESLQGHVEVLLGGSLGVLTPEQRSFLEAGWRNGRRLLRLVEDLETIALAEFGGLDVEWAPVDLGEVATLAAERIWPIATGTRKRIALERSEPARTTGAADVVARAVEAVLERTVEASRPGAEIRVSVAGETVEVAYAAESAPAADDLSLALAEATCRLHGGQVTVAAEDGTTTVALSFAGASA